jgi:ankyrin repeat protein
MLLPLAGSLCAHAQVAAATHPGKVDFAHDVQPILQQECLSCHGAKKQTAGLRLDSKSNALQPGARRIVPGSPENSAVYLRVSGSDFGAQMPPTGELKPAQIATIKQWISEGADWPIALSVETPLPPIDPKAVALVQLLHEGKVEAFVQAATAKPALLNARGPEGSTPFMYAALYTGPATLKRLLALGADPNRGNDVHATALLWAAGDLEKTRLLLEHGADVNAESTLQRTPLMIAARHPGGAPIVKLLLEHGANVNPHPHPEGNSSPLLEAVTAGDAASFRLLVEHGADVAALGETGLTMAVASNCPSCLEVLAAKITKPAAFTGALADIAVLGDLHAAKLMLDHGADVHATDPTGRTALMYAVTSDLLPLDEVKLLIDHGADVNARDAHKNSGDAGLSVLEMARSHGDTPIVKLLLASGAKPVAPTPVVLNPREKFELRSAIQDALPLLQIADANFAKKSGCVSCHNNSLTAMTMGMVRQQGFRVDEKAEAAQVQVNATFLADGMDVLHEGFTSQTEDNFSDGVFGYMLVGLDAEHHKADVATDAAAMFLLYRQQTTGEWQYPKADTRQPLCLDYIGQTALAMRALQLYPPKTREADARKAVALAAAWIANAKPYNNDDLGWRVMGLAWAGDNKPALLQARQELLAAQKPDGSWSDLPSMEGSAYATGKSLVSLQAGGLPVTDPHYQRGVDWLLHHQQKDGTWYIPTRAMGFQPAFDAGFPYGHNQWISAAGSNWATMALTLALPAQKTSVAGGAQ